MEPKLLHHYLWGSDTKEFLFLLVSVVLVYQIKIHCMVVDSACQEHLHSFYWPWDCVRSKLDEIGVSLKPTWHDRCSMVRPQSVCPHSNSLYMLQFITCLKVDHSLDAVLKLSFRSGATTGRASRVDSEWWKIPHSLEWYCFIFMSNWKPGISEGKSSSLRHEKFTEWQIKACVCLCVLVPHVRKRFTEWQNMCRLVCACIFAEEKKKYTQKYGCI